MAEKDDLGLLWHPTSDWALVFTAIAFFVRALCFWTAWNVGLSGVADSISFWQACALVLFFGIPARNTATIELVRIRRLLQKR